MYPQLSGEKHLPLNDDHVISDPGAYARRGGGARGSYSQWLHDSPLSILYCQERPPGVLKIVENLCAVGALSRTPLGSSQRSSRPPSWWGGGLLIAAPKTVAPAVGLPPFGLPPMNKSWALFRPIVELNYTKPIRLLPSCC